MLNPIKRVWVPKKTDAAQAAVPTDASVQATQAIPAAPSPEAPKPAAAPKRHGLFEELPEPDVEERNSDSVWAEFDSVLNTKLTEK